MGDNSPKLHNFEGHMLYFHTDPYWVMYLQGQSHFHLSEILPKPVDKALKLTTFLGSKCCQAPMCFLAAVLMFFVMFDLCILCGKPPTPRKYSFMVYYIIAMFI